MVFINGFALEESCHDPDLQSTAGFDMHFAARSSRRHLSGAWFQLNLTKMSVWPARRERVRTHRRANLALAEAAPALAGAVLNPTPNTHESTP